MFHFTFLSYVAPRGQFQLRRQHIGLQYTSEPMTKGYKNGKRSGSVENTAPGARGQSEACLASAHMQAQLRAPFRKIKEVRNFAVIDCFIAMHNFISSHMSFKKRRTHRNIATLQALACKHSNNIYRRAMQASISRLCFKR